MAEETTTIRVKRTTKASLEKLKIVKEESFDSLFQRMMTEGYNRK